MDKVCPSVCVCVGKEEWKVREKGIKDREDKITPMTELEQRTPVQDKRNLDMVQVLNLGRVRYD